MKGTTDLCPSDCVNQDSYEEQQVSWWGHAIIQTLVTLHTVSLLQSSHNTDLYHTQRLS